MSDNDQTNGGDCAFSKKEAAAYLGISVRKLEYAMESRLVEYEKHVKKVVFHRTSLDNYRTKCIVKSKNNLSPVAPKSTIPAPPSLSVLSSAPQTILISEVNELLRIMSAQALADRGLTKSDAKTFLVKLGECHNEKADALLADYEEVSIAAWKLLGNSSPKRAVNHQDWSFSIAAQFIHFVTLVESWRSCGEVANEKIQFRTIFDPTLGFRERILPCLQSIPESEFLEAMKETESFFTQDLKAEREAFYSSLLPTLGREPDKDELWLRHCDKKHPWRGSVTRFVDDQVPFHVALAPVSESSKRKPVSFVGPTTEDNLRELLINNFGVVFANNIIFGQVIPLPSIAKLRWLHRRDDLP